ncbi:MAG: chloramphenicol acetyltransferase [bacterium]|nr:chloramphenicol acetyltransferase [bacterium]
MERYRIIDLEHWERKQHYWIFKDYVNPRYDISFELDITTFLKKVRDNGWSFTLAMIHSIAVCANQIEEFRYRFEEGQPVVYDILKLSFTYLNQETRLLKNIVIDMKDDMEEFNQYGLEAIARQKAYFTGPVGNDCYQFSSIPWISFTHISHTVSGKKDFAVPMFDWGKYYKLGERVMLPFSMEVHHSFVDGIHIGQFAELLQEQFLQL